MTPERWEGTLLRLFRKPKRGVSVPDNVLQVHNSFLLSAKKILSTSLFIKHPEQPQQFLSTYYEPLLLYNTRVRTYHPTWTYRIYVPRDFPPTYIQQIVAAEMEVCVMTCNTQAFEGTFWRFLPLFDTDPEAPPFLSCDADLEITDEEFAAAEQWLVKTSHPFFHIQIPFLNRFWSISAGRWGARPTELTPQVKNEFFVQLQQFLHTCNSFGCDELYLQQHIAPAMRSFGVYRFQPYLWTELVALLVVGLLILWLVRKFKPVESQRNRPP